MRSPFHNFILLFWCWQAVKPLHGYKGDTPLGYLTSTVSGLNYLRAILTLYFMTQDMAPKKQKFDAQSVSQVLHLNSKYFMGWGTHYPIQKFNEVIRRYNQLSDTGV